MKKEIAEKILKETESGYDSMSQKFSETRKYFWRGLEFIANYAKKGEKVLDFGCGNGRLLKLFPDKDIDYLGVDVSQNLVDVAKKHYQKQTFQKINPLQITLPFADDFFNTIFSIAVFHHFPSKKYREDVAKELYRITKKNGYIVITVWNLWQKKYIKNIIDNWINKIYLNFGGSTLVEDVQYSGQLDWNDCYISFTNNEGKKFQRFHHAFTKCELRKLFASTGFKVEKCAIIKGRNILLVCKK